MKKPAVKKAAASSKPAIAKKAIGKTTKATSAKTTKATSVKTTKAVPKKRNVVTDDDSDGGMGSTPPEAKKQKKAPAPRKAVSKAKPWQSGENESEIDFDDGAEGSGSSKTDDEKNSGDAYQKVCIRPELGVCCGNWVY